MDATGSVERPRSEKLKARREASGSEAAVSYAYSLRWARWCSMTLVRISGSWTRGS